MIYGTGDAPNANEMPLKWVRIILICADVRNDIIYDKEETVMVMKMHVKMTQHPVGQGGLFSGSIRSESKKFRFVYDCGGTKSLLKREIEKMKEDGEHIDMLFISHLHSDHVNGVEHLLDSFKVRTVALPYLSFDEKLAIIYRNAAFGRVQDSLTAADIIWDPAEWFSQHDVGIMYIEPNRGDGSIPESPSEYGEHTAPTEDDVEYGDDEVGARGLVDSGDQWLQWIYKDETDSWVNEPVQYRRGYRATADRILVVSSSSPVERWALIPYVHSVSDKVLKDFLDSVHEKIEVNYGSLTIDLIKEIIKCRKKRKILCDCYNTIAPSQNLVTMTLYSGPFCSKRYVRMPFDPFKKCKTFGGWMLTGDADLKNKDRRDRFIERYSKYGPFTSTLMIPHHGSIHNFDDSLLNAFTRLDTCYVAVGDGRANYNHPHPDVVECIEQNRMCVDGVDSKPAFQKVGKNIGTRIELEGYDRKSFFNWIRGIMEAGDTAQVFRNG